MQLRTVGICGNGELGRAVAAELRNRADLDVSGPSSRGSHEQLLDMGADVVVIATTTRLADVATQVSRAVAAGSNVIVSAEEAAFPWLVDDILANRLNRLARSKGVTILGGGVNPGFIFDSLVLTVLGVTSGPTTITVRRVVDVSGFGPAVRRRLGIGFTRAAFAQGLEDDAILGHAGFPQSMAIVAASIGLSIDRIERRVTPVLADRKITLRDTVIDEGESAGVDQHYVAFSGGRPWYTAEFLGHVDLEGEGLGPRDEISLLGPSADFSCTLSPGVPAQRGSCAMIVNSIDRVIAAPAGWLTVADLPPAHPWLKDVM